MPKGKKPKETKKIAAKPVSRESRAAEVLTVLWTQSAVLTTLCNIGSAIVVTWSHYSPDSATLDLLWRVLLFGACVGGLIILGLTRPVHRLRRELPPTSITVFAIAMAVTPLLAAIILFLQSAA